MIHKRIATIGVAIAVFTGGILIPSTPADAASAAQRTKIVKEVKRQIGKGYRYGAAGPSRFDCSGLTLYVTRKATGKKLPHNANSQKNSGRLKSVSKKNARAGDYVFFVSGSRAYHVGIYAGNGKVYDIGGSGKRVTLRKIWTSKVVYRTLR